MERMSVIPGEVTAAAMEEAQRSEDSSDDPGLETTGSQSDRSEVVALPANLKSGRKLQPRNRNPLILLIENNK